MFSTFYYSIFKNIHAILVQRGDFLRLQFILGKPGSGKTTLCHRQIAEAQATNGENSLILIVPEQFSFQSEKALIKTCGGAISRAQVLSFGRLSYFVLGKTGGIGKTILEDIGKNMILRKIVSKYGKDFEYFKSGQETAGFLESLSTAITEFYHYNITPEDLKINYEKSSLGLKLNDLRLIYSEYKKFLEQEFISSDEILDILAEKIPAADFLSNAEIWIDGFKSFTPQEKKVLTALLKTVKSVKIALPAPRASFKDITPYDVHFEVADTIERITTLAIEAEATVLASIVLNDTHRHKEAEDLAFLCDNYLGYSLYKTYSGIAENINISACENIFDEIENTAKIIAMLTRDRGYKYSEIGMIAADLSVYSRYVPALFARHGIPVFIDNKRSILSHPAAEMILAACQIISSNWSYEAVFRLLRLPMFESQKDFDLLENYVLAKNVKWQKTWEQEFDGNDNEVINIARCGALDIMRPLMQKFTPRKKYPLKDFAQGIYEFLMHNQLQSTLEKWMDTAMLAGNNEALREHEQIWDKIVQVLNKIVEILPDQMDNIAGFAKILEAGITDLGLAPPSLDQLVLGDLRRSRFGEIKALLILGAKDGAMPSRGDSGSLLSDEDKMILSTQMTISKNSTAKMYEEDFLIYSNLSKPSDFLGISYPVGDLSGKGANPARAVQRMIELFPNMQKHNVKYSCPEAVFADLTLALGQSATHSVPIEDGLWDSYSYFSQNINFSQRLAQMRAGIEFSQSPQRLSKTSINALYSPNVRTSVSKLQRYIACPFSYFAEYNLAAKKREIYEVAAVDMGNIYHDILAKFGDILQELGNAGAKNEAPLIQKVDEIIDEVLENPTNWQLKSSGRYMHFAQKMRDISRVSALAIANHFSSGEFALSFNEVGFGVGDDDGNLTLDAIEIELSDNAKMLLQGRIDRVDIGEISGADYIKIIDYKSGRKQFSLDEVYYGLDMQLLIYLGAFVQKMAHLRGEKTAAKILPAAAFYFNLLNPLLDYDATLNDPEVYKKKLLEKFRMSGLVVDDEDILSSLDDGGGSFKKDSAAVSAEDFAVLMQHVMDVAKKTGEDIITGNIDIMPYKHGKNTPCGFCNYRSICKFDAADAGSYRNLKEMKKDEVLSNTKLQSK
ncbi:MAG: exodeoxyribonuclease V subunit gamma [Defluviitaleaceae bacterium]|nr:exodeoxyribonuclease V subunit gamma [Defluviitaleaceae bacterium]